VLKEFKADATPDSTWEFTERKQTLSQKGSNNIPVISDFSLTTESGNDSTDAILNTAGEYYLLYIKDLETYPKNWEGDLDLVKTFINQKKIIFIVTSQLEKVKKRFNDFWIANNINSSSIKFLSCDATVMKTVARVNPTLYLMNGPVVKNKWSWTAFKNIN